jgi:hypothetical protein
MQPSANADLFQSLRKDYPVFEFSAYRIDIQQSGIRLSFDFNAGKTIHFAPSIFYPYGSLEPAYRNAVNNRPALLHNLAFSIGMIELISYWKATCSPQLRIRAGKLSETQTEWWKKLYFNGLGEFFYVNGITASPDNFMEIVSESETEHSPELFNPGPGVLVPIGGGKDSAVTLELLLRSGFNVRPLIMNPRGASLKTVEASGIPPEEILEIRRTIDPVLLRLNEKGFLNGHTPFSAMLAFHTILASFLSGNRYIALSNESSANESTIPGTGINHQYSKTLEFETDFRSYCSTYISPEFCYFSFLRPLSELRIASLFAGMPAYHTVFRSCNAGSKTDSWCGKCPKCLFTAVILAPFTGIERVEEIIGSSILNDSTLIPVFDELCGFSANKPFECVGTIDEVNEAVKMSLKQTGKEKAPALFCYYAEKNDVAKTEITGKPYSSAHHLPEEFLAILTKSLL